MLKYKLEVFYQMDNVYTARLSYERNKLNVVIGFVFKVRKSGAVYSLPIGVNYLGLNVEKLKRQLASKVAFL